MDSNPKLQEATNGFNLKLHTRIIILVRMHWVLCVSFGLNQTRRYGPLCGPTSSNCGGLWLSAEAFVPLGLKKRLIMLF